MEDSVLTEELLKKELKPLTLEIDRDGFYPRDFLKKLGEIGAYRLKGSNPQNDLEKSIDLIEEVSKYCCSTGFAVWCHMTAINYVLYGESRYLKENLLSKLQCGEILGGTALSNPIKYYAKMEALHLKGEKIENGYIVRGNLPYVSNCYLDHWFGIIFEVNENKRIMAFIPFSAENITLRNHYDFLGLNGTGTYECQFKNVHIREEWIISENADEFVEKIKPIFILNQIGMGLGLIKSSMKLMNQCIKKQNQVNQYLDISVEEVQLKYDGLKEKLSNIISSENPILKEVLELRLEAAQLALASAQTAFLCKGAAGYFRNSEASRVLREAYFVAIVSPAIKHLKKILEQENIE